MTKLMADDLFDADKSVYVSKIKIGRLQTFVYPVDIKEDIKDHLFAELNEN
jgi:hypothetical protein